MKIGVYGDSFAEKRWGRQIWWRVLQQMGHDVESYGEGGSNIIFSALRLEKNAHKYDFNIWVVSDPGRISFPRENTDEWIHVLLSPFGVESSAPDPNSEERRKLEIAKEYWTYLMEPDQEILVGESIVRWMLAKHKNLMVIPGFSRPLKDLKFNLRGLSDWELSHYMSQSELKYFYQYYNDLRAAHLVKENNRILAELINQNLTPGIFQTEYSNFMIPTIPLEQISEKRS